MTARITGVGTSPPGRWTAQDALWDGFYEGHCGGGPARARVFRGAGVRGRHLALNPLE